MKFQRRNPVIVEAVQWFKEGDHPDVTVRHPEIVFSQDGALFYVSSVDDACRPKFWMPVDESSFRVDEVLPFAFWKVRSGEVVLADTRPDLYVRYWKRAGWEHTPKTLAYVKYRSEPVWVEPGMWIVQSGSEVFALIDSVFNAAYEPAPVEIHSPAEVGA